MIWSPLSNLLLYGNTARVDAARQAGVTIGLGSDWSPTGSKNLLGEMKVAWLHSQQTLNGLFSARDIVAMATRDAARILKWDKSLGTLAAWLWSLYALFVGDAGANDMRMAFDVIPNAKAEVGFEPTNNGFAIRPLSPLGYSADRTSAEQYRRVRGRSSRIGYNGIAARSSLAPKPWRSRGTGPAAD